MSVSSETLFSEKKKKTAKSMFDIKACASGEPFGKCTISECILLEVSAESVIQT